MLLRIGTLLSIDNSKLVNVPARVECLPQAQSLPRLCYCVIALSDSWHLGALQIQISRFRLKWSSLINFCPLNTFRKMPQNLLLRSLSTVHRMSQNDARCTIGVTSACDFPNKTYRSKFGLGRASSHSHPLSLQMWLVGDGLEWDRRPMTQCGLRKFKLTLNSNHLQPVRFRCSNLNSNPRLVQFLQAIGQCVEDQSLWLWRHTPTLLCLLHIHRSQWWWPCWVVEIDLSRSHRLHQLSMFQGQSAWVHRDTKELRPEEGEDSLTRCNGEGKTPCETNSK